ncbi:MAG: arginine--tRNA ligase [Alphaproteobacteria bacterium]|nr:arginine--tRNA ligase [Alphaproteobacteria bacterium]
MRDLAGQLTDVAGAAFSALGLEPGFGAMRRSDRPDLADFQCNGAMAAAKAAKRNPREIADAVVAALRASDLVASAETAGPGFINVRLSARALNARVSETLEDPRAGAPDRAAPRRVMIDFGGWNVAKPMHIGHLRSTIIGDSLQRLFRFMGETVVSDVHLGDWGLQMGLLIIETAREQPDLPYFDAALSGSYPSVSPVTMEDLERLYPQASARAKDDETWRAAARTATAELQAGRPGYRALWRHFCEVTRIGLERECADLGVKFDLWKGESDAEPFIPELVDDLKRREIAVLDEGAWIVRVARESDTREVPPFLLVNRDGAVGYHATDLGTILDRRQSFDPELTLYVVDQRQALHFEQVFRASEIAGYTPADRLEHIGFGTMNGRDGKPFKTREGGVLKLHDLIRQAREAARVRLQEAGIGEGMAESEIGLIADRVAISAIKFADLSNVRTTNYVFDLDRFISFEGKTGPYLLYAAVRMKSLVRRAREEGVEPGPVDVRLEAERTLALSLDGFAEAVSSAALRRMPHILCDHAYQLAQAFSAFYAAAPILAEKDEVVRAGRLSLTLATLNQLERTLDLIGISTPERM